MSKKMKVSTKVFIATSLLCLVNIGVFIYQLINLKFSMWAFVPTFLVVMIVVSNIIFMIKNDIKKEDPKALTNNEKLPRNYTQRRISDNEDFYAINTSFPTRLTTKSIVAKIVFVIVFALLALLFNGIVSKIDYDMVVTGNIKETYILGSVHIDEYANEVVSSDNRKLVIVVRYEVEGKVNEIEVIDGFSHSRDNGTISLCVKNDGTFVCAYDNITSYKVMFYASIVMLAFTLLGFVFTLPNQYLVLNVLMLVGVGIICLFNSYNWSQWLLKDFTLFGGCFATLGAMAMLQLIILRIIYSIGVKKDPAYTIS